jgi:hypothetical protein
MRARRSVMLACGMALVASACGGGGDDVVGAGVTAAPEAGAPAPEEPATVADAGELPAFMSEFSRVCTTQVGFPGAATYSGEPGLHPIALFEEYRDEDNYLETSRTLPAAWVITQDADYEDNTELARVELVGCADLVVETPTGTMCTFDADGEEISLELVDATYEVAVYEATTGEQVASERVQASRTTCPAIVSYTEGQTQLVNDPTDDQIINVLKPVVDP